MKKLTDLTKQELENLYDNNAYFKSAVDDYNTEDSDSELENLLCSFNGIKALDYNIGYPANHMTFLHGNATSDDYMNFIVAVKRIETCWGDIFAPETIKQIDKIKGDFEAYHNEACVSGKCTLTNVIDEACEELLSECVKVYDWRFDTKRDLDVLCMIAERLNDFVTDGQFVYATVKYA